MTSIRKSRRTESSRWSD